MTARALLGPFAVVFGVAAFSLAALDGVPRLATGGTELRAFATLGELERAAGRHVALPAYYPASLEWPPAALLLRPDVGVAALAMRGHGGGIRLWLAETLRDTGEPGAVLEHVVVLDTRPLQLGAAGATLARVRAPDGVLFHQLAWEQAGRSFVMRSSGPLEELLRMAQSVHGERS